MRTVKLKDVEGLVYTVLFHIGFHDDKNREIIQSNSINIMMKLYDTNGKKPEEVVSLFNEKVKNFIPSCDKVEMKLATTTFVVTTNYNIIE